MKRFLTNGEIPLLSIDLALTVLRIFAGLTMALTHGAAKLPPSEQFVTFLTEFGFPVPLVMAWSAGLSELVGGLLLAAGLFTRPAAFFLVFTMAIAAFVVHAGDPFAKKELALVYLLIYTVFLITGSGKFSVDAALRKP